MRGRSPSPYDRRRSPIGRRDRRFPGPRDRRRPRSFSPPQDRGRRTPTYKRFRREDEYYDRYDRGSPAYRRSYDRDRYEDRDYRDNYRDSYGRGHPDRREHEGPQSYKEFMIRLPDEITPEDAAKQYQEYLASWWGSRAKAQFEQQKDEDWMREKYDPRAALQTVQRRKEAAKEAKVKFDERLKTGELNSESPDFNQGAPNLQAPDQQSDKPENKEEGGEVSGGVNGSWAAKENQGAIFYAPVVCWTEDRLKADFKLSAEVIKKLDTEKGLDNNPLFDTAQETAKDTGNTDAASEKTGEGENGVSKTEATNTGGKDAQQEDGEKSGAEKPEGDKKDGGESGQGSPEADEKLIGKLDLQLTYLWEVHAIDYYAGHELTEKEFKTAKCRMLRAPKLGEGDKPDEETDKKMLEELRERVDNFWNERIKKGDPYEGIAQAKRVEAGVDKFVESQVTPIDDKKWGNKLSPKLFVGKEFVLKHIKVKHAKIVAAEREKILDEIFFENYKREKEEEERRAEEQRKAEEMGAEGFGEGFEGFDEGFGGPGRQGMVMGGRGTGGHGMMGPMVPGPMMGAPMGQVLLPAPGAGPLGPFILQMSPMEMGQMGFDGRRGPAGASRGAPASRGGPTGRGAGRGWGGGGAAAGGYRDYYDLDAPQNNRAFLDYGDL